MSLIDHCNSQNSHATTIAVIHYTHTCFYCKSKNQLGDQNKSKMADFHENYVIFILILFVLITDNCENVNNDEPNCHFGR